MPSVLEVKFAKEARFPNVMLAKAGIQNPYCISPFAKGETKRG
jgi:hypothetical protein